MRKYFSALFVALFLLSTVLSGCGTQSETVGEGENQTVENPQTQAPESMSPSNSSEHLEEPEESSASENQDGDDSNGTPVVYFTSFISLRKRDSSILYAPRQARRPKIGRFLI